MRLYRVLFGLVALRVEGISNAKPLGGLTRQPWGPLELP